jgi:hypothetical protein
MVMQGRYPVRPSGPLAEWVHPFRKELIRCGSRRGRLSLDPPTRLRLNAG